MLAGISVEYYTRLERGNVAGASSDVIEGIAVALQLDQAERAHLFDLVRAVASVSSPRRRASSVERVRPTVQRLLDSMVGVPAYVRNGRLDIIGWNALGGALYSSMSSEVVRPINIARFIFLNPAAEGLFVDWDAIANDAVAILRAEAGRDPFDRRLSDLVGELSTRSDEFRVRWARHDVRLHSTGRKRMHHPVVGMLELDYEAFVSPLEPDQMLLTYTAEPGSPTDEALRLLASWMSTPVTSPTE